MNEAKLSYTIRAICPQGFDEMYTVRGDDPPDYFSKILALKKWLVANGYTPTRSASRSGANGNATDAAAPPCDFHGSGTKPSKKHGGFYCPKKLPNGTYCQWKSAGPHQAAPAQGAAAAAPPMPQAQAVQSAANEAPPPLFDEGPPPDSYYSEN